MLQQQRLELLIRVSLIEPKQFVPLWYLLHPHKAMGVSRREFGRAQQAHREAGSDPPRGALV